MPVIIKLPLPQPISYLAAAEVIAAAAAFAAPPDLLPPNSAATFEVVVEAGLFAGRRRRSVQFRQFRTHAYTDRQTLMNTRLHAFITPEPSCQSVVTAALPPGRFSNLTNELRRRRWQ